MLIRLACAIKEKRIVSFLKKNLAENGFRLTWIDRRVKIWPVLESTGADLMVISRSFIPRPIEKSLAALKQLPETPLTVILDDRSDAGAHAELVVAGADQVLYAGLPLDGLRMRSARLLSPGSNSSCRQRQTTGKRTCRSYPILNPPARPCNSF